MKKKKSLKKLKLKKETLASLDSTQMNQVKGGGTGDDGGPQNTVFTRYVSCFASTPETGCNEY